MNFTGCLARCCPCCYRRYAHNSDSGRHVEQRSREYDELEEQLSKKQNEKFAENSNAELPSCVQILRGNPVKTARPISSTNELSTPSELTTFLNQASNLTEHNSLCVDSSQLAPASNADLFNISQFNHATSDTSDRDTTRTFAEEQRVSSNQLPCFNGLPNNFKLTKSPPLRKLHEFFDDQSDDSWYSAVASSSDST